MSGLTNPTQDDMTNEHNTGVQMERGVSPSEERDEETTNTLSLIKEDLSVFKEDLISLFKDKEMLTMDMKTNLSAEGEHKTANTLSLFKEDFNQFKEDFTSMFKIGFIKEKEDGASNPKICLAKEDLSGVFKINPFFKEKTSRKTAACPKKERGGYDLKNWFETGFSKSGERRNEEVNKSRSEKRTDRFVVSQMRVSEEPPTDASTVNLLVSHAKESTVDRTRAGTERPRTSERRPKERTAVSKADEEKTTDSVSESEDDSWVSADEEDDRPSMPHPLAFSLPMRNISDDIMSSESGGKFWPMMSDVCYLTLDPNTANSELSLSEENRKVSRLRGEHMYPDHPERFDRCPQVLCREGLLGTCYWEVEWSGGADVGVTYNSISRDGDVDSCLLGHNDKSWSLECSEGFYTLCHENKRPMSSSPKPFSTRVGVFLDWPGGRLSFYGVFSDVRTHLFTFHTTFTEPLYPGFWLWGNTASVSLCQVKVEGKQLIQ